MAPMKKRSRKRDAILAKIRSTKLHPSAEWIYEELKRDIPDLSLGTVYRNLSVFKREGVVVSVGVVDGQERFDGNVLEHAHFVCLGCGAVIDVDAELPPSMTDAVEKAHGVKVNCRQLTFYGQCARCFEGDDGKAGDGGTIEREPEAR